MAVKPILNPFCSRDGSVNFANCAKKVNFLKYRIYFFEFSEKNSKYLLFIQKIYDIIRKVKLYRTAMGFRDMEGTQNERSIIG